MASEATRLAPNAFTAEFLRRLDESGEPDGAHEAEAAGPWSIRRVPYRDGIGFALLREWEDPDDPESIAAEPPFAVFRRRDTALLAAAVLPATGRQKLYHLGTEADAGGFPLSEAATTAGHLRDFDEDLAAALNLAAALVRSPRSLAWLIEAAGYVATEIAGRILLSPRG